MYDSVRRKENLLVLLSFVISNLLRKICRELYIHVYLNENSIDWSKLSYCKTKKYTQIKIDENMINIITRIDIYMYMHVYTIVYSYLGKTLLKPVQF